MNVTDITLFHCGLVSNKFDKKVKIYTYEYSNEKLVPAKIYHIK